MNMRNLVTFVYEKKRAYFGALELPLSNINKNISNYEVVFLALSP